MPAQARPWRLHYRWRNTVGGTSAFASREEALIAEARMQDLALRRREGRTFETGPARANHVITEVIHRDVDLTPAQRKALWRLAELGHLWTTQSGPRRSPNGARHEAPKRVLDVLVQRGYGRWVYPARGETLPYVNYTHPKGVRHA